jgi:lipopolysaccharide exporter
MINFKSAFVKNVATMLAGNVFAQMVALLAAPIITRLYDPGDFGTMAFIQSSVGVLSVVACFRYRCAIVLPKKDSTSHNLLALSLLSVTVFSLLLTLLLLACKGCFVEMGGFSRYDQYLFFIPIAVFIISGREVLVYYHTRLKKFSSISASIVLMPFVTSATKIVAGLLLSASAFWLILGNMIGQAMSGALLFFLILSACPKIRKNVSLLGLKQAAREYYRFPRYSMPTAFINSLSQNLPVFLYSYYFSQEVVGFYGLANMILRRPISVMSEAMSKTFLQKSAEIENNRGALYPNLKKATIGLAVIGIIPFGVLMIAGKSIFGILFGLKWSEAGLYAQVLAPWLFLAFINSPANQIYTVKQKLRFQMYFNYIQISLRFISIVLGYYLFNSALYATLLFSMTGIVMNIWYIIYAFLLAHRSPDHRQLVI